jgi:tetratricopeptide (TPR) repeat protein
MRQGSVVRGEQNIVVQIVGDGNTVSAGHAYLTLSRRTSLRLAPIPTRAAKAVAAHASTAGLTPAGEREADLLSPFGLGLPLVGRGREMAELERWLDSDRGVSVRVLAGSGGRGKTRLALELCEARSARNWRTGFVTEREMRRFGAANLSTWGWNAPTLVVVDYAAAVGVELRAWLAEVAEHPAAHDPRTGASRPLRLLLLERQAEPGGGWWAEAFGQASSEAAAIGRLLDPPEPWPLGPIETEADRHAVFAAAFSRAAGQAPRSLEGLGERLREQSWGGEPLFLAMAGLLAARFGVPRVLGLPADDLALALALRELERIRRLWRAHGLPRTAERFAAHMAAVATLRGGLTAEEARAAVAEEKRETGFESAGDGEPIRALLHAALPAPNGGVAPIQPDVLGVAALLMIWDDKGIDGAAAARRAAAHAADTVAANLVRACQDFVIHGYHGPLGWLRAVHRDQGDFQALRRLAGLIPRSTVGLREVALEVTQQLLRVSHDTKGVGRELVAGLYNDLSGRLAGLGRAEEAATAAKRAVAIHRALAKRDEAFRADLASALTSLSGRLADLGRAEEAFAAAEEAVGLLRDLAAGHREEFQPYLAASLGNLGNRLADLGRATDAAVTADEAASLFRAMAAARPGAFRADLASALANLGNRLADVGHAAVGLAATEEAVAIRRDLAAMRPDAFRPDLAASLGNLALALVGVGRTVEAAAAAEEAVGLLRGLAAVYPRAFRPHLARALLNLGSCNTELDRREQALSATEEASNLFRALAEARPEAFCADLAGALSNLGNCLTDLDRSEDAVTAAEEAVGLLRGLAITRPNAFQSALASSVTNLAICLSRLDRLGHALTAIEEAVELWRLLPRPVQPGGLARSLILASHLRMVTGRPGACAAAREAVALLEAAGAGWGGLAEAARIRVEVACSTDGPVR